MTNSVPIIHQPYKNWCFAIIAILLFNSADCQTIQKLDSVKEVLENIFKADQNPRIVLDSIQKKFGNESAEVKTCWDSINRNDSINQVAISNILHRFGWLSKQQTSKTANEAIFLVIQHAPLDFQKKYLPLLLSAIKSGAAEKSYYPFLSDRIHMREDKYQIFGTQISGDYKGNPCFWPILNEPAVNIRRHKFGLNSIENYAKECGLNYHAPVMDSLKGKSIINGYVTDSDEKHLAGVKVYSCNHRLLAISNADGIFKILLPDSLKKTYLIFIKTGYKSSHYSLTKFYSDISFNDFVLNKR